MSEFKAAYPEDDRDRYPPHFSTLEDLEASIPRWHLTAFYGGRRYTYNEQEGRWEPAEE